MSQEIILDFLDNGTVEGMHFDEFPLDFMEGHKTIARATEIFFNEEAQNWEIVLPGYNAPCCDATTGFSGYSAARKFEVLWLQECRKQGTQPNTEEGESIAVGLRGKGNA